MGLLFLLVVALIVLGILALIGVSLWRAGRWGIAALAVLAVVIGWNLYLAANPRPEFYRTLFERETGVAFPAEGRFLARDASYPDATGDYCAAAVVEIGADDAQRLRRALRRPTVERPMLCGDVPFGARGPYRATLLSKKEGRAMWWGVSEDGRSFTFSYVQL